MYHHLQSLPPPLVDLALYHQHSGGFSVCRRNWISILHSYFLATKFWFLFFLFTMLCSCGCCLPFCGIIPIFLPASFSLVLRFFFFLEEWIEFISMWDSVQYFLSCQIHQKHIYFIFQIPTHILFLCIFWLEGNFYFSFRGEENINPQKSLLESF